MSVRIIITTYQDQDTVVKHPEDLNQLTTLI